MNLTRASGTSAVAPHDFAHIRSEPYQLYLNSELAPHADAVATALRELGAVKRNGIGNRGGGFRVALPAGPELFVRRSRRGGAIRYLLDDIYFGFAPRPLIELQVTVEAARRGVPLAQAMGAAVRWVAPGIYRGFFVTRPMPGMTLWSFLCTDDDADVRTYVLARAREALETMLRAGLYHPDLNLENLFVTTQAEDFGVIILDLDKAHLGERALGETDRRRIAARLLRSARKLDPHGRFLDSAVLSMLDFARPPEAIRRVP
jgi:hypothetical protein